MNAQELRSLQEAYLDVYEGKVPWNDPKNPLQSGHTPAEKNRAKRERTGVEDIKKSPSDKNYATYGAMKSVDDEQSSSSNKNKSTHKFPDVPIRTSKGKPQTIGQLRRSKGVPKPGGSDEKSNLYQSPIKKDDKRTRGGKTDQWKGPNPKTESYDLYDIILSHLLDEGYADTQEAAETIMVNMSEEWRDDIVEGRVPWNDPKNPNPSGYTPKEKSEAKRKQLGVDNPNTSSFEKGGPGEKEYARHGNLSATQQKMSKRGQQPKGKPHEFRKNPFWKKDVGQMRRIMGTKVPEDKKDSYPSKN